MIVDPKKFENVGMCLYFITVFTGMFQFTGIWNFGRIYWYFIGLSYLLMGVVYLFFT